MANSKRLRTVALSLALLTAINSASFAIYGVAYAEAVTADNSNGIVLGGSNDSDDSDSEVVSPTETADLVQKLTTTTETEEFKTAKASGSNPLDLKKDQETLAVVQNELLLFQNLVHGGGNQNTAVVFDNYENGNAPVADVAYQGSFSYKNQVDRAGDRSLKYNFDKAWNFNTDEGKDRQDAMNKYSVVKAVACDPFGTGRDSCVAYVGLNCTSANTADVVTWLYDYSKGKCSEVLTIATLNWDKINETLTNAQMSNFMAITAGNYHDELSDEGFAMDSVVAYAPSTRSTVDPNNPDENGLIEIKWQWDDTTKTITLKDKSQFRRTLLHPGFYNGIKSGNWMYSEYVKDKLACDLATGDFNADGIEDIAVLSYVGDTATRRASDASLYIPYIGVAHGSKAGSTGLESSSIVENNNKTSGIYFEQSRGNKSGVYLWDTARSPGLAVGDANGDGVDEIAVAGIKVTQGTTGSTANSALYNDDLWYYANEKTNMVLGVYAAPARSVQKQSFATEVQTNKWKQEGVHLDDCILERSGIAFLSLNGQHTQEQLFIDGSIYSFKAGTCEINEAPIKTADYFNEADNGAGSASITNTYIQSIAVGNFDNNYAGREQVMFVIGLKSSGERCDALALLSMGGVYKNDTETETEGTKNADGSTETIKTKNFGTYTGIYDNGYKNRECYLNHCELSNIDKGFACVVVAVDMDDDGLKVKYSNMGYLESDVEVQAVIQAAPYFKRLRQYEESSSATTYKITGSYSYKTSSQHSDNVEYGGVVGLHVEAPVLKWDLKVKIGHGTSYVKGTSETRTQTYSASFTATKENLVVLRRNPIYRYTYDYIDADGQKSAVTYDVGQAPYYVQLSINEYNAMVDGYNEEMQKRETTSYTPTYLCKITEDYLSGNVGNPWKYQSQLGGKNVKDDYYINSTAASKGEFAKEPNWVQLGYAAGYTEVALTDTTLNEDFCSQSSSITASAETTLTFTCGFVGGAYVSSSSTDTTGTSTTTGSGSGISTKIGNIDKAAVLKDQAASEETIDQYGFKWTFAGGDILIGYTGGQGKYVPLLHHIITDLSAPIAPVTLTEMKNAEDGSGDLVLTWKLPEDDGSNRKFYEAQELTYTIYQRNASEDTPWEALETKLTAESCTQDGKTLTKKITPRISANDGNIYQYAVRCSVIGSAAESVNSNYKTIAFMNAMTGSYCHIKYSNDGGKTFTGNGGEDVGTYMGIYTDNNKTDSTDVSRYKWIQMGGSQGEKGEDGKDGTTPELKIEDGYWYVSYDGTTWTKLGSATAGAKGDKGDTGEQGEKGEKGDKGDKGDTGEAGADGAPGRDGQTPYVGENGNWWIGDTDTGIVAKGDTGAQGEAGITPQVKIDKEGIWCVSYDNGETWNSLGVSATTGTRGEKGDTGENGLTPYVGDNGNWWIGDEDTGVAAKGTTGMQGEKGDKGEKGDTGATGQSGKDGRDGRDGHDGADGADGVGIAKTEINDAGELIITYTNGVVTNLGKIVGSGGKSGTNGKDGVGIAKTEINDAGELVITYTDGTETNLGSGITGVNGTNGADGLTPYIGTNGNWWIGNEDTGVKAAAEAVVPASSGAVTQTRTIAIVAVVLAGVSLLSNIGTIAYIVMRRRRRRHHG